MPDAPAPLSSRRIVIEVEPSLKEQMYSALAKADLTMRAWFMREAQRFCEESFQPTLFSLQPAPVPDVEPKLKKGKKVSKRKKIPGGKKKKK